MKNRSRIFICAAAMAPAVAAAAAPGILVSAGTYTAAQAGRGQALYGAHCASCHGEGLNGADAAPPLTGARFIANWRGQTVADLVTRIHTTMPLDDPGSVSVAGATDVAAYIFSQNQFLPGNVELPRDAGALQKITIDEAKSNAK